jgi:hypothetical protein
LGDIVPTPGLVIPYTYLWRREHEAGEEAGRKVRPALFVIAVERAGPEKTRVAVCPITRRPPTQDRAAVEMPAKVKAHLGLDGSRSWIICDEYNEFDWPGVDLGRTATGDHQYGLVPDALVERVRMRFLAARAQGRLNRVACTE